LSGDGLSTGIGDYNCNIGKNYGAEECDPPIRAWEQDGENEAGGTDHHANEVSTSPRRLIDGETSLSRCDGLDL
jgi:hypothetical protein